MTCSLHRGSHPFLLQIIGTDLVGSARHNLLGGENAVLDQPADAVVCNPSVAAASDIVSHSPSFSAER